MYFSVRYHICAAVFNLFLFASLASSQCISQPIFRDGVYHSCQLTYDDGEPYRLAGSTVSEEACKVFCERYKRHYAPISLFRKINATQRLNMTRARKFFCDSREDDICELGRGSYGSILTDGSEWAIKLPPEDMAIEHERDQIFDDFKKENERKLALAEIYHRLEQAGYPLSQHTFFDASGFEVCDGKSCLIKMKRIKLHAKTKSKDEDRQQLYRGELDKGLAELIKAVAELFAMHLVGADFSIPRDLELALGTILEGGKERFVVTLLDYGFVHSFDVYQGPSAEVWRQEAIRDSLMVMRPMIPPVDSGDKFAIFVKNFLATADALGKGKEAQKMIEILVGDKK